MDVDPSLELLRAGNTDAAWTMFVDRYRRLILAVVRRYVRDHDDTMDLFAFICEQLRANDMARIRKYADAAKVHATITTWIVAVSRNLAIDWIRMRDGRPRHEVPSELSPLGKRLYTRLFLQGRSLREACEMESSESNVPLTEIRLELIAVHRVAFSERSRHLREARAFEAEEATLPSASEADAIAGDARRVLRDAMQDLDPELRLAVQLFVVDGMPASDIARVLDWNGPKTVYNRVYRALAAVREALQARGIHEGDL